MMQKDKLVSTKQLSKRIHQLVGYGLLFILVYSFVYYFAAPVHGASMPCESSLAPPYSSSEMNSCVPQSVKDAILDSDADTKYRLEGSGDSRLTRSCGSASGYDLRRCRVNYSAPYSTIGWVSERDEPTQTDFTFTAGSPVSNLTLQLNAVRFLASSLVNPIKDIPSSYTNLYGSDRPGDIDWMGSSFPKDATPILNQPELNYAAHRGLKIHITDISVVSGGGSVSLPSGSSMFSDYESNSRYWFFNSLNLRYDNSSGFSGGETSVRIRTTYKGVTAAHSDTNYHCYGDAGISASNFNDYTSCPARDFDFVFTVTANDTLTMSTDIVSTSPASANSSAQDVKPGDNISLTARSTNASSSTVGATNVNLAVYNTARSGLINSYAEQSSNIGNQARNSNVDRTFNYSIAPHTSLSTSAHNQYTCFKSRVDFTQTGSGSSSPVRSPNRNLNGETTNPDNASACFRLLANTEVSPTASASQSYDSSTNTITITVNGSFSETLNRNNSDTDALDAMVLTSVNDGGFTYSKVAPINGASAPGGWTAGSIVNTASVKGDRWGSGEVAKNGSVSGFSAQYTVDASSVNFGDELCFYFRVLGGNSASASSWVNSPDSCVRVVYPRSPYLEVIGGDVYGGGSVLNTEGACDYTGSGVVQGNVSTGSGIRRLTFGQFFVGAATSITNFGSRNTSIAANAAQSNDLYAEGDQACRPDLIYTPNDIDSDAEVRKKLGIENDTLIIRVGGNALNSLDLSALNPGFASAENVVVLHLGGGDLVVGTGAPLPVLNGKKITIYSAQDVIIRSNIVFSRNYAGYSDVPAFAVITSQNIKVSHDVTRLTGLYYSSEVFDTCARPNGSAVNLGSLPGGSSYPADKCYNQLEILGSVSAGDFIFRRIGTRTAANPQSGFAERINTIVEQYLARPPIYDELTRQSSLQRNQLQNERPPLL